jgi:hypothetical protein
MDQLHYTTWTNLPLVVMVMVFNATFNNISVISWQSVLLVEETGLLRETTFLLQLTDNLCHIKLYQVHPVTSGIKTCIVSGDMQRLHR